MGNNFMRYPLDWDTLNKGDELSGKELEDVLGKKMGTDEFRFAAMGLQALIHEKRPNLTVKIQSDNSLRVLTDVEASEHNDRLFEQYRTGMLNRREKNVQVDTELLTPPDRLKHEKRLFREGRYVSALTEATRVMIAEASRGRLPNGKPPQAPKPEEPDPGTNPG